MSFLRSKRGVFTLVAVLLLALFLVRPGANRLRTRIVNSISMALGRQVDVAAVRLRLFPQPGFDLEDFVVHDDPAFSAEPVLRAQEVTASLRLISILRGRLEIARLNLTEPSLNLVRDPDGHWNLENLIERAARIPSAPTSKAKTEKRPGFPYIEADRGRINFKLGPEKKPYALTDADFALWQDSENAWGMRLKAQPVRTDLNLSDTGLVSVIGSWQRAATLRETPLQFNLQWDRAQLGQATKLIYGRDRGWRGSLRISTTLTGTAANLAVATEASVVDFRRYDIPSGEALRLAAQCSGRYSSLDHSLTEIACNAPVGDGMIALSGKIEGPFSSRDYDLAAAAQDLPLGSLMSFARHIKQGLPSDLATSGRLNAKVKLLRPTGTGAAEWQGSGETSDFHVASKLANTDLVLGRIPFAFTELAPPSSEKRARVPVPEVAKVEIGPFNLALGRPVAATVQGWVSGRGYAFAIQGDAQVQRLLRVARMLGIPAPQPAADGVAKLDLQIAGDWAGFAAPRAMGKAQIRSVRAEVRGLNEPLEIASANLLLEPDQVNVQNLTASVADTSWHGSVTLPRQCVGPTACPVGFDLHVDEITTDKLNELLNPHVRQQPWYRFLASSPTGVPFLLTVRAAGKITAAKLVIRKLVGSRVSGNVELDKGKLRVFDLRADVLGGKHTGEWQADFTVKPPMYSGRGKLERIALDQLAESMNDDWIAGWATTTYQSSATGLDSAALFASATSTLQIDARDGVLRHVSLGEGSGPLQMHRLTARLSLRDGKFDIEQGNLETAAGTYQMSGTATLTRILDLKLTREGAPGFNITGTLTEPHVVQASTPETRAELKP